MYTKVIKCVLIIAIAIIALTSCWSAKYRTYSIDNTGQIKKSRNHANYKKGYGTYIRDFHVFYSIIDRSKFDTMQLKQNASLLFLKVDKHEREKYFKDYHIKFTSDTSGVFILNKAGLRDKNVNCDFIVYQNKCHIHYYSSASKF